MQQHQRRNSTDYATAASERLWDRFAEMFGARFYEQFGQKPTDSWREAVAELRADQVKEALRKIRNGGGVHPPSLPEFIALARNSPVQREKPEHETQVDDFHRFGQLRLLELMLRHGPASDDSLSRMVDRKNALVEDFRATYCGDRSKVTNDEWQQWNEIFMEGLTKLHEKRTAEEGQEDREKHCASMSMHCDDAAPAHVPALEEEAA